MHEHILVVDDEKEIADLLEVYLKNDGYTVHKFYNGLDALQCCADSITSELLCRLGARLPCVPKSKA